MTNDSDSNSSTMSTTERNITLGFYIGTFFLGLVGNVLVIAVISGKKNKRTVYDLFILNLGIADFSFIVFCLPIYTYGLFGTIYQPAFYCRVVPPLQTVVYFLSIFTITFMAIHRCRLIVNPYKPKPRKRTAYVWIGLIWLSSFIIVLPLSIVNTSKGGECEEGWPSMNHRRAYTLALFILQFLLPLLIIAVAYLRIGVYLWRSTAPQTSLSTEKQKKNNKRKKENMQVIKTLAAIVILFAICLIPGQIAWLMLDFGDEQGKNAEVIFKYSAILDCLHACVNPIIYGLLTEQFRREYIRYFSYCLLCGTKRVNTENDDRNVSDTSNDILSQVGHRTKIKTEILKLEIESVDNLHELRASNDSTNMGMEQSLPENSFSLQETAAGKYVY